MGILDDYELEYEKDKKNENNDFPEGSELKEEQRKDYEDILNKLRNRQDDIRNAFNSMKNMNEEEMTANELIKEEDVKKVVVKHAYCDECGEELISKTPPMFNPYTLEKICKHTCAKCGKTYNLEYAYPRLAFINENNEEIQAFTI